MQALALRSELSTGHVLIIVACARRTRDSLESIEFEHMLNDLLYFEVYLLLLHLQLHFLFCDLLDTADFLDLLTGATDVYHGPAFFLFLDVVKLFLRRLVLE